MSSLRCVDYLGKDVSELLKRSPFSEWRFTRCTDEDLPEKEVRYEFEGHGVDLLCDEADRVITVFLRRGDGEALSDVPFALSRREVLERFGPPSKSGNATRIPALGERGPWDRFTLQAASLHIQYKIDRDEIEMTTLMSPDMVP